MNVNIKYLKDETGSIISPVTSTKSIYDTNNKQLGDMKTYILNLVYPVGSIYYSINSTSPATLFGGTWEQIKDVFLLSAGTTYTAGNTGGSASHTHTNSKTGSTTLTSSNIPQHSHGVGTLKNANATITGDFAVGAAVVTNTDSGGIFPNKGVSGCFSVSTRTDGASWNGAEYEANARTNNKISLNSTHTHTISGSTGNWGTANPSGHTHTVSNTGSSSNMPPYLIVYVWKRTK